MKKLIPSYIAAIVVLTWFIAAIVVFIREPAPPTFTLEIPVAQRPQADSVLLAAVQNKDGKNMLHAAAIAELEWRQEVSSLQGQATRAARQCQKAAHNRTGALGKACVRAYTISHWIAWDAVRRRMLWEVICSERGKRSVQCIRAKKMLERRKPEVPE